MGKRPKLLLLGFVLTVGLAAAGLSAVYFSYDVRWRMRVVVAKLSGKLTEIPAANLLRWLAPGSPVYVEQLAVTPNPHAAVANLRTDAAAVARGQDQYRATCAICHGEDARGKIGPELLGSVGRMTDWAFFSVTKWGRPGTAMAAQALGDTSIWDVHAYLRRQSMSDDAASDNENSRIPRNFAASADIPSSATPNGNWLTYAGNLAGHRHADLPQITPKTIAGLELAWVGQLRPSSTAAQASPIVSGGLLFATESREGVVAFEAATGNRVWHYRRSLPEGVKLCCGYPNRGAAILGNTLYLATIDAHLVALDAATGAERWSAQVAEASEGYSITGAPLAFGDRVIVGVAGSLYGIRGQLAAFSATDGRLLWRFWTVPAPGQPGHDTWAGDSWKRGGSATWTVGSYDPELNLVIWGVGNPAPVFNGALRQGDNLYSNSVIALDATTGQMRWHYQFTPNDEHDWDAAQQPVLTDSFWRGERRPVVLWANRNAFFYAIDRRSGEFLFAEPFAKQTWAAGFDKKGRPLVRDDAAPSATGTLVWPVVGGATSWWPPSLDRKRGLLFVPTVEAGGIYFKGGHEFAEGNTLLAGVSKSAANHPSWAGFKAIEIDSGKTRWKTTLREGDNVYRAVGGILSMESGVLFGGYEDVLYGLDAASGSILWTKRLGARVSGAPVGFTVGDRDHIAVTAGNALFVFRAGKDQLATTVAKPAKGLN